MKIFLMVVLVTLAGCDTTIDNDPDSVQTNTVQDQTLEKLEQSRQRLAQKAPPAWATWKTPGTPIPTTRAAQGLPTVDDYIAEIAERAPGFGGMYYESGQLNIHLKNTDQKAQVVAAVADLARASDFARDDLARALMADPNMADAYAPRRFFSNDKLQSDIGFARVRQGQYDFRDLVTWRNRMRALLGDDGVNALDIDDRKNRVRIDVRDQAIADQIRKRLTQLGVPIRAVIITTDDIRVVFEDPKAEPTAPPAPQLPTQNKLTDFFSVMPGGIKISSYTDPNGSFLGTCSLGVIAWWGLAPNDPLIKGFITNSHCTELFLEDDPQIADFYQPVRNFAGEASLGIEWQDTQIQNHTSDPWAYGDYAFVSIAGRGVDMGRIAHPEDVNEAPPDLIIDPITPVFHIRSDNYLPIVGHEMHSVGERSGWVKGDLELSCVDLQVSSPPQIIVTLMCQFMDDRPTLPGDSGSPVFVMNPADPDVEISGIHWGRATSIQGNLFRVWSWIAFARGSLTINTYFHECDWAHDYSCP